MAKDFRTDRVRTGAIIGSGSVSWGKPTLGLLLYSGSRATSYAGGSTVSLTDVGTDIWMAVDGSRNMSAIDGSGRADGSSVLFMGDVVVSGTLWAERSVIEVDDAVLGDLRVPNKLIQGFTTNPTTGKALFLADPSTPTLGSNGTGTISFKHVAGAASTFTYGNAINRDVFFHVSGSRGVKNSNDRGLALFDGDLHISGNLSLEPESTITVPGDLDVGGNLSVGKNFTLTSNGITGSAGLAISFDGVDTTLAGDLTIGGNTIKGTGGSNIELGVGGDVKILNDLTIQGDDIKGSSATTIITLGGSVSPTIFSGDIQVNGKDIKDVNGNSVIHLSGSGDATFNKSVTIVGDLNVSGSTVTVDVENLRIEDPLVLMGAGASAANSNGGIAVASGSSVPNQALTFGRGGIDLFRAGRADVIDGTANPNVVESAEPVGIQAAQFRIPHPGGAGTNDFFVTASIDGSVFRSTISNIQGSITVIPKSTSTFVVQTDGGLEIEKSDQTSVGKLIPLSSYLMIQAKATSAAAIATGMNGQVVLAGLAPDKGSDLAFGSAAALPDGGNPFPNKIHTANGMEHIDKRGMFISGSDSVIIGAHATNNTAVTRVILSASANDAVGGPLIILSASSEYLGGGGGRHGFITVGATALEVNDLFTISRHRDVRTLLSGSVSSRGTNTRGVTLATGDLVISGNTKIIGTADIGVLNLDNLSLTAEPDPYIQFNNSTYKVFKEGDSLKFQDNITGPVTLADLNSLSVVDNTDVFTILGGEPSYIKTTGSFSFDTSNRHTTALGSDVYFFVSGSELNDAERGKAVFGGDVYISGTLDMKSPKFYTSMNTAYRTPNVTGGVLESGLAVGAGAIIDTQNSGIPLQLRGALSQPVPLLSITGSLDFVNGGGGGNSKIQAISAGQSLEFWNPTGKVFDMQPSTLAIRFPANNKIEFAGSSRYIRGLEQDSVKKIHIGNDNSGGTIKVQTNNGHMEVTGSLYPGADNTYNLGSPSYRWANVYTGDLHLRNDRGNWTIYEEPDMLVVVNNLTGKKYKMGLTPLEDEE